MTFNGLAPVKDDRDALVEALAKADDADVLVTTGGASVGDHDLIRPALEDWGARLDFWRVKMKPGKPIMVARRGKQFILGLPGNPVSAYVGAFLFLYSAAQTNDWRRHMLAAIDPGAIGWRFGRDWTKAGTAARILGRNESASACWSGQQRAERACSCQRPDPSRAPFAAKLKMEKVLQSTHCRCWLLDLRANVS